MSKILVVDDDFIARRTLSLILKRYKYDVTAAESGFEALEYLAEQEVDLIILDLAMPGMDGLTLLKKLRADARFKKLPIIMLTASGLDEDYVKAKIEGVNDFLTKPTSSWELVQVVERWL